MAVNDDLSSLLGGGLFTPEDLAAADALVGGRRKDQPMVWVSGEKRKPSKPNLMDRGGRDVEHGRRIDEIGPSGEQTADAVAAWVYDPVKRKEIEAYLQKKGFDTSNFDDVEKAWQTAVDRATRAYEGSGKALKRSPWEMIDDMSAPEDTGPKPVKGLSWSSSQTDVDMAEMPPEMVRQGITTMLQDLLGRGPTESEVNDFAARAAAIAAEDPYTRTTTSHQEWDPELEQYVNKGSTVEESGISQAELNAETQEMAREDIANSTEAKEFGRVRGINVLMEMLGAG